MSWHIVTCLTIFPELTGTSQRQRCGDGVRCSSNQHCCCCFYLTFSGGCFCSTNSCDQEGSCDRECTRCVEIYAYWWRLKIPADTKGGEGRRTKRNANGIDYCFFLQNAHHIPTQDFGKSHIICTGLGQLHNIHWWLDLELSVVGGWKNRILSCTQDGSGV